MDEIPKPDVKPLWLAIPITLHAEMVRVGLDVSTRDLNLQAWSHVATYQTDGRLTNLEASHLYSSTRPRRQKLVDTGFWKEVGTDFEVIGYLEVNRTRARIEKERADHRVSQKKYMERLTD